MAQIFEQLNENILLNGKVIFTISGLRNWVYGNIDYPKDISFDPKGIHKEYWGNFEDFCIDKWLDEEPNFQNACSEAYKVCDHYQFQSANTEQETNRDLK